MRSPLSATTLLLLRHSLYTLRPLIQVFPTFSISPYNFQFFTNSTQLPPKSNKPHTNLSSINFNFLSKYVLSKNPQPTEKKCEILSMPSLKDCIFRLSTINPEVIRRFRRVRVLKPEDVLEILVGFEPQCEKFEFEVEKVKSLWGLFTLASENDRGFEHLPKSYELIADLLVRVRLLREIEYLFSIMDSKGILLDSDEIFSNLIIGYVKEGEIEKAISVYNGMKTRRSVPSMSCYRILLKKLIAKGDTHLSFRTYMEMLEMGLGLSGDETCLFENVVLLLCRDGRVQEARNLVRRVIIFGIRPSDLVLDEIASGYCEKKDYDDLLKFFAETKCELNVLLGNKMIHSLCSNFGVERSSLFLQEMENIGFSPNEVTYGILIGWSCRERKLKSAFIYFSEILSQSLIPDVHSYNALISGLFMEGMWKHARDILYEMDDRGVIPNYGTFKVLLAGYSKYRRFDEVKELISEMIERGFVHLSSIDDPLSKAFTLLGLDPLSVKLKRDNNVGLFKTEFFDKIGNGLYLETDRTKFEKVVNGVLEDSLVPDFNFLILENCGNGNFRTAVITVKEMVKWGQELSFSAFTKLVKGLCSLKLSMKTVVSLIEKRPNFTNQLDQETLNLLVQELSEKFFLNKTVFEGLVGQYKLEEAVAFLDRETKKVLVPDNINYDSVIKDLCRYEKEDKAIELLNIMLKKANIPCSSTYDELIRCSCQLLKLDQALDLIYEMLDFNLVPSTKTFDVIICHVCQNGRTSEGERLLNMMIEIGEKPTREIYCSLIDRYYYEKNLNKASGYLQQMQQNGHEPDFATHWSLISNLKNKTDENSGNSGHSFLSRLLSYSGFSSKKDFKAKS